MKNSTLRKRTESLMKSANSLKEYYVIGYELKDIGRLIINMAGHIDDLQRKVDSQAEALRNYQQKSEVQNG